GWMPLRPGCAAISGASARPSGVSAVSAGLGALERARPSSGGNVQPASSRLQSRARRRRRLGVTGTGASPDRRQLAVAERSFANPVAVQLDDLPGRGFLDGVLAGYGFDVANADAVLLGPAVVFGPACLV